jgi:hypothetical protein
MYRIKATDFSVYEISKNSVKKSKMQFPEAVHVAELFKAHNNLKELIDSKNPEFLKGGFSKGKVFGARINVLPTGEKLDKMYPLFAPKLTIHDEKSNSHWDVIFQNPSGKMAYLYTLKKDELSRTAKYKKVDEFERLLPTLKKNLINNFEKDDIALPIMILLKTKMRVGNEIYYKKNSHKGLTTLKKKDIKISKDKITFNYIAKDGVPRTITEIFPDFVIKKLKKLLKMKKANDFVFSDIKGHPIKDTVFEKAFEKYCGQKFYPHIIRSHYATTETLKFLKENPHPSKEEVRKFYFKIANKLGHKKFSKKNGWQDSYQVTLHHYINPKLVKKITKITK